MTNNTKQVNCLEPRTPLRLFASRDAPRKRSKFRDDVARSTGRRLRHPTQTYRISFCELTLKPGCVSVLLRALLGRKAAEDHPMCQPMVSFQRTSIIDRNLCYKSGAGAGTHILRSGTCQMSFRYRIFPWESTLSLDSLPRVLDLCFHNVSHFTSCVADVRSSFHCLVYPIVNEQAVV